VSLDDDRVELLEGIIVAERASDPPHATACLAAVALTGAASSRAAVRVQLPLVLGSSVPEPDVAVVPGHLRDYGAIHPGFRAARGRGRDSSLAQDRLTKAAIYATAAIPDYWIVNLRGHIVEVMRAPDTRAARYNAGHGRVAGTRLELAGLPGASVLGRRSASRRLIDALPSCSSMRIATGRPLTASRRPIAASARPRFRWRGVMRANDDRHRRLRSAAPSGSPTRC